MSWLVTTGRDNSCLVSSHELKPYISHVIHVVFCCKSNSWIHNERHDTCECRTTFECHECHDTCECRTTHEYIMNVTNVTTLVNVTNVAVSHPSWTRWCYAVYNRDWTVNTARTESYIRIGYSVLSVVHLQICCLWHISWFAIQPGLLCWKLASRLVHVCVPVEKGASCIQHCLQSRFW